MRRRLFGILVGAGLLIVLGSGPSRMNDGVSAVTNPLALFGASALLLLFFAYPREAPSALTDRPAGIVRRVAAFAIDYLMLLEVLAPFVALLSLWPEAAATGRFAWRFEREFSRPTDLISIVSVFFALAVLFAYFYLHSKTGRQTIGQYLMGTMTIGVPRPGKRPSHVQSIVVRLFGLVVWPISLVLALRRQDHAFWWDEASATAQVRTQPGAPWAGKP